jgi:predicted lactoylglutathione lyase
VTTKIFVNLQVKDLNKTIEFFTKLGFKFNPHLIAKDKGEYDKQIHYASIVQKLKKNLI